MSREIEAMVRRADLLARDDQLEELFGDDLFHRLLRQVTAQKEGRMPETTSNQQRGGIESTPVTGDEDTRPRVPGKPTAPSRRRWVPALVAMLAVMVVGGAVLLFLGRDEPPPAATDPESIMSQAIAVAESFIEAYNAYDAGRARDLLAEDVQINSPAFLDLAEVANIDKLEAVVEVNRIIGFQYSPYECGLSFQPAEVLPTTFFWVLCTYDMDSRPQQIVGYPPVEGTFSFGVVGGLITRFDDGFPFAEWGPNVDEPFIAWLGANHPGAFDEIYGGGAGARYPRLTSEALELLAGYLDEYEASADN